MIKGSVTSTITYLAKLYSYMLVAFIDAPNKQETYEDDGILICMIQRAHVTHY